MAKTLFDVCTLTEGTRSTDTISITVGNRFDDELCMEERLLINSEYALLRGSQDSGFPGLLREVNIMAVRKIDKGALQILCSGILEEYRKNAVFLMNAVTLHEISLSIGHGSEGIRALEDGFRFMEVPILLTDAMPCIAEGRVPILYGDFSKVRVEDCGYDKLQQESYKDKSDVRKYSMTGYLNCVLEDKQALLGMKIV